MGAASFDTHITHDALKDTDAGNDATAQNGLNIVLNMYTGVCKYN